MLLLLLLFAFNFTEEQKAFGRNHLYTGKCRPSQPAFPLYVAGWRGRIQSLIDYVHYSRWGKRDRVVGEGRNESGVCNVWEHWLSPNTRIDCVIRELCVVWFITRFRNSKLRGFDKKNNNRKANNHSTPNTMRWFQTREPASHFEKCQKVRILIYLFTSLLIHYSILLFIHALIILLIHLFIHFFFIRLSIYHVVW